MMTTPLSTRVQYTPRQAVAPMVEGRALWWVSTTHLPRRHHQRKITFSEALKDFLRNVSFHCYDKLVEPRRCFLERFFWIVFHITMLSVLFVFLWKTYLFKGRSLGTAMYDPMYPINKVPFPTISICTLNRMSNASVTRYAEELNMKDPEKHGVNFFYKHINKLSSLYSASSENDDDFEEFLEFQNFLDIYDTSEAEGFYNTRERMRRLTPKCKDILVSCRLADTDFDCLTEFKETLTASGFCCTFNSNGAYSRQRPYRLRFSKQTNGLLVLLNGSRSDEYIYSPFFSGFLFYFYSHGSFADIKSGAVNERFVQTGTQTAMSITPLVMQTDNDARSMPVSVRKCYFPDEQPRIFGTKYSYNNCITRCRMNSISVLCNCVPFSQPEKLLDENKNYVYCTLRHKACLERYYFKWSNAITEGTDTPGLEHEMEDSLWCPQCLPVCTWTRYAVNANELPMTHTFSEITESNMTDQALIHIFFGVTHAQLLMHIPTNTWVEALSFIGNILSIVTGFSLVGFCELLFFCGRQLLRRLRGELCSDRKNKREVPSEPLLILP